MALLSREDILAADDLVTKDINVPEWGGTVRVQSMNGRDRDAFEAELVKVKGKNVTQNYENLRARLVSKCLVDDKGNRLFSDMDVKALGRKSAATLNKVFEACQELNGMSDDEVDEMAENFEEAPGDSSSSD